MRRSSSTETGSNVQNGFPSPAVPVTWEGGSLLHLCACRHLLLTWLTAV